MPSPVKLLPGLEHLAQDLPPRDKVAPLDVPRTSVRYV